MEVNSRLLTLLAYIFNSCSSTIIVKFGGLARQYSRNLNDVVQLPDPLAEFDLRARQLLCDSVISAQQFMQTYPQSYYVNKKKLNVRIGWDLPAVFADATWNYQRLSRGNLSTLGYKLYLTQIGNNYVKIKGLCCVHTKTVKWYLTFGLVDHFMYLLERGQNKAHPSLLFTGMIEPSAFVHQKSLLYFRSQLVKGKSRMELLCKKSQGDKIRICSAIYNALDMGNGARLNYRIKPSHEHIAVRKLHSSYRDPRKFKFLQCDFFRPESGLESFLALADIREQSSVFVFFEDKIHKTVGEMTRVTKIGALLNPLNMDKEREKTNKVQDEDILISEPHDESCKKKEKLEDWCKRKEICIQKLQTEAKNAESSHHGLGKQNSSLKEYKKATELSKRI